MILTRGKREPAAEGGRSIGLIGYLSVYKKFYFIEKIFNTGHGLSRVNSLVKP